MKTCEMPTCKGCTEEMELTQASERKRPGTQGQKKKGPEFSGHIAVYTAPDLGKWGKLLEGWFLYIEIYPGDIL